MWIKQRHKFFHSGELRDKMQRALKMVKARQITLKWCQKSNVCGYSSTTEYYLLDRKLQIKVTETLLGKKRHHLESKQW